jgi:Xaa-Pro aminopeptidase
MSIYEDRLEKCSILMEGAQLDVLLLTKPANTFCLTGDGRLCAHAMLTQNGQVALRVPKTDVEDVERLAHFDPLVHAFFHGEEAPPPLPANVVLAVGNCGLYAGPWGVQVEDTLVIDPEAATG